MTKTIEEVTQSVTDQITNGNMRLRDVGSVKIQNETEIHLATKFHPPKSLVLSFGSATEAQTGLKVIDDALRGDANLGVKPKFLAGGPALAPTGAWL